MTSYAAQKGRAAPTAPVVKAATTRPLTPAEEARVAENRAFVIEHMPELLPMIRSMHAEGLIDGWRSIKSCRILSND